MKKICPLIQKDCLEHGCEFYTHLLGQNPQTGVQEDKWGCAVAWLPILLIENANMGRQAVASTDKVANEVAASHHSFLSALPPMTREMILNGKAVQQLPHKGDQ